MSALSVSYETHEIKIRCDECGQTEWIDMDKPEPQLCHACSSVPLDDDDGVYIGAPIPQA